jgi:hypothetical protein
MTDMIAIQEKMKAVATAHADYAQAARGLASSVVR